MFIDFQYEKETISINLDHIVSMKAIIKGNMFKGNKLVVQTSLSETFDFNFKDADSLKMAINRIFNKRFYEDTRIIINEDLGLIESEKRSSK